MNSDDKKKSQIPNLWKKKKKKKKKGGLGSVVSIIVEFLKGTCSG